MILHLDMDAFYASVEQLDNPWLRGRCVIVGGTGRRGVVSAASYEARKFGVRSAMPAYQARQLCPQGVFLAPRMHRYQEISRVVMKIIGDFSPQVEPVSIDEAFADLAGTERLHGPPAAAAAAMKKRIRDTLGLTCSVGLAPNRFLAKIASDLNKPDGLTVIAPEEVTGFVERLPLAKVPGVGPKMLVRLEAMGVRRLGEIRRFTAADLQSNFGKYGERLLELARGIDPTPIVSDPAAKSASSECTLSEDTRDGAVLARCLLEQCEEVAAALRREGVKARTVVLKVKHADFTLATRRTTFAPATQSSREIYRQALRLLESYRPAQKIRLIGLGATGFVRADAPQQQALFSGISKQDQGWEEVDRTLEKIRSRFGAEIIARGTLSEE
jgi:DNA polymerase-4